MKAQPYNPDDVAMAEAERWLARLHAPDCTAAERLDFERWRAANPAHEAACAAVETTWSRVGKLAEDPAIAAAFAQAQRPVFRPRFTPLQVAASLAAIAILGVAVYRFTGTPDRYHTALGEQRRVTLSDGSAVTLDTATIARVAFDADARRIYLDEGRAHFVVARDSERPFSVVAEGSVVTALGTAFDVRNEAGEVTVTLVQGKVQVALPADTSREVLSPGEQVTISRRQGIQRKAPVDLAASSGWAQGNLIFKATALGEALAEVNRYTDRKIHVADSGLAAMPISGVFHVGDPEAVVVALEKSFPIKASRDSAGTTLLIRDPSGTGH